MTETLDPDDAHEWLAELFSLADHDLVIAGVNEDDCAVLQWDESILVLTTDFLNTSPIAVELGIATPEDLGRLVVASSVSDLCGSGARPRFLMLGAMLQRDTSTRDFHKLMTGAKQAAAMWDINVVGGDTKLGSARALFSVGIGSAKSRSNLFLKNGGQPGDLLWCSGPLGSCSAATLGLSRHSVTASWGKWAKNAILNPEIPLKKSRELSMRKLGNGGIDLSDGLGSDVHKLCHASSTGAVIDALSIPFDEHVAEFATAFGIEPWRFAFGTGGDCQFVVSTDPATRDEVANLGMHLIGKLTKETRLELQIGNQSVPLPSTGHRDAHGLAFSDEIVSLLRQVSNQQ